MDSIKDTAYIITKEIKRGKIELPEKFIPLRDTFFDQFGITPINFFFEILPHNNKPRLQLIFNKTSELRKLRDQYAHNGFENKIIDIFISTYKHDNQYPTENSFIICSAFDQLSIFEAHLNIPEDELETGVKPLVKNFWCIQKHHTASIFVFGLYDCDTVYNQQQSEKVQKVYFDLLSGYDEFNYLEKSESLKVIFDTKENFDKNYNGSWRNYFDR